MAEITINIDDYMTPEDIKVECMEAIKEAVFNSYYRDEGKLNRLITNLSYEFIFKAVDGYQIEMPDLIKSAKLL